MCGKTRNDSHKNERFREQLGVASIDDKMCPKTRWRDLKGERATIFKAKVIEEGDWNFEGKNNSDVETNG